MANELAMTSTGVITARGSGPIIPAIIVEAGDQASEHFRAFFHTLKASTYRNYAHVARRFCKWAFEHELTLATIQPADVDRFEHALRQEVAASTADMYLAALRSLFRYLTSKNVIPASPFEWQSSPSAVAGFDLLAVLAMLANMEADTLRSVFEEEPIALAVLQHVRWRRKPFCPICGSDKIEAGTAKADPSHQCLSCGQPVDILAGTMFEASPLPLRHWLRLIHQQLFAAEPSSDAELAAQLGIDLPTLSSFRQPIEALLDRLPSGDDFKNALDEKDRQLVNDVFGRDVMYYAELVAARDSLITAKAEGTAVPDFPPGMSLEEVLAEIEQRIAEEDRWVFYLEDGRIRRKLADETLTDEPEEFSVER